MIGASKVPALNCLKRFKAEHVDRSVHQDFAQPLAYGGLVHETLKCAFAPGYDTSPGSRDLEAFARRAAYRQGYPDPTERDRDVARCVETVQAYVEQDADAARP